MIPGPSDGLQPNQNRHTVNRVVPVIKQLIDWLVFGQAEFAGFLEFGHSPGYCIK